VQGVASFCNAIKRDPITGQITNLSRGNANLGSLETEGYDLSLAYRFPRSAYGRSACVRKLVHFDQFRVKADNTADWELAGRIRRPASTTTTASSR
jgi:iron complex outermembrane receptor protein